MTTTAGSVKCVAANGQPAACLLSALDDIAESAVAGLAATTPEDVLAAVLDIQWLARVALLAHHGIDAGDDPAWGDRFTAADTDATALADDGKGDDPLLVLLDLPTVAARLCVSRKTLGRRLRSGRMPAPDVERPARHGGGTARYWRWLTILAWLDAEPHALPSPLTDDEGCVLGPPTATAPGSMARLAVLAERVRRGQALHHPADA